MVDLAKIRKKAKKKEEDERAAQSERSDATVPAAPPGSSAVSSSTVLAGTAGVPPAAAAAPVVSTTVSSAEPDPAAVISKLERFKAEAGQRRGARIEQVAEAAHQLELLTFTIAGEQYAIDIEKIVEIVTPRAITRIPNAGAGVVGITSLRGTIVTLVDVRARLRHRSTTAEATEHTRIVVIDLRREIVGFLVDRVQRVVKIAPADLEPHPVVHSTELEDSIRGVFRAAGALTILLDLDKLLDHAQWT